MALGGFELGGGNHPQLGVETSLVEPVDPLQGAVLNVLEPAPGTVVANQVGLVETVERFGQGVDAPIDVKGLPSGGDLAWTREELIDLAGHVARQASGDLPLGEALSGTVRTP